MASTARSAKDTKEFFDPPEVLERKATQMVDLIKRSKHCIVFTVQKYWFLLATWFNLCGLWSFNIIGGWNQYFCRK